MELEIIPDLEKGCKILDEIQRVLDEMVQHETVTFWIV